MLGKRIINTATGAGAACTTDTVQILGDTSLVAYYKMSDATDETGSYDGTPTNVNFNVAGKFGNAGEFNGSSSKIDLPNFMPSGNASRSVSMWIKTTQTTAATLFQYGGGGTNLLFNFRINDGGVGGGANTIGIGFYANDFNRPATGLMDGNWHHVAATYDGTNAKIYIDGSQTGANFATGGVNTTATTALIGSNGGSFILNGSIDQIRIFDRAITSNEVTTLYNEVYCQPTIVPTDYFNTVLYTGAGATNTITGVGFSADMIWIKDRDSALNHLLADTVRGISTDSSNTTGLLLPNLTNSELTNRSEIKNLSADGFDVTGTGSGSNTTGDDFVAWNWKAGGAAVSNTDGTITSQVSANTDAGFSIVSYTANATSGATIGHGLDQELDLLIVKSTNLGQAWNVYVKDVTDTSAKYLRLNENFAILTTVNPRFIPNNFTDSVFSVGNDNATNGINGTDTYIAYCFHSVDGMSRIGSYVGNGGTNSIVTGFRPAFVIIKPTSLADNWLIYDNKRGNDIALFANLANGDTTYAGRLELNSNGFTINTSNSGWNGNNASYIFMAFAEEVFVPDNFFNDDSTVATYKLNGDAGDDSGNGYNGTASNVTYATGKFDDAAVFNGSSSKITTNADFDGSTAQGGTISFWFKTLSTSAQIAVGSQTSLNGSAYGSDIYVGATTSLYADESLAFWHYDGANTYAMFVREGHTAYQNGEWFHCVITSTSNTKNIYINGVDKTLWYRSGTLPSTPFHLTDIQLGVSLGVSDYWNGSIDQVRIFNRALDSGEVTQLYNE